MVFRNRLLCGAAIGFALAGGQARAADPEPIRIGVIAETSAISGVGIPNGAAMAAEEINAAGGVDGRKIELFNYDDHSSSADAVRAFQRAVSQDHVVAVVATYTSEVALALEPWAARLHVPFITPGAASNEISRHIHEDYDHNKYTFHEWLTSAFIAQSVCDFSKDVLVPGFGIKSAVVLSEDAAWTTPLDVGYIACLPKVGIQVLDHIRFSPDTTDFTPLFNQIEGKHPDVIMTGISHVGVQPTVQWHAQQVPIPMAGDSSQATTSSFWKDTNGAADGVITQSASAPGVAITATTVPFTEAYIKRFGNTPGYVAYSTHDSINVIAAAIKRAGGSTDPDKLVDALEKTDYVGTIGRVQFYGKDDQFTHAMKYGPEFISGIMLQWQNGKQVTIWPKQYANAKVTFPSFVKVPEQHAEK